MAITKKNKRQRHRKQVPVKRRNSNLVRIPRDNTIRLAVWNEELQGVTLTNLTTEEAGNIAMYMAKNRKVIGPGGQEMVSNVAELQTAADALKKTQVELLGAHAQQASTIRKKERHIDGLKQTLGIMVSNQRQLLDVVQNMIAYPVVDREEPTGMMADQSVARIMREPGMQNPSVDELTRKIFDADLKKGR